MKLYQYKNENGTSFCFFLRFVFCYSIREHALNVLITAFENVEIGYFSFPYSGVMKPDEMKKGVLNGYLG